MNLEPNSEWFHIRSLNVVTIGHGGVHHGPPYKPNEWIHCVVDGVVGMLVDPNRFLAEYRRNVPITGELLSSLGFKQQQCIVPVAEMCDWYVTRENLMLKFDCVHNTRIWDGSWIGIVRTDADSILAIPSPQTLRDLLILCKALALPIAEQT